MEKLFLIFSYKLQLSALKKESIVLPSVWGGWEKDISLEEFPFENINNLTSVKGQMIFKGDSVEDTKLRKLDLGACVLTGRNCLEREIKKSQVELIVCMESFQRFLSLSNK